MRRSDLTILKDAEVPVEDVALVKLLTSVYVGEGFTEEGTAAEAFTPAAVRARGQLYWASDSDGNLRGTVMLVPADSAARRLARTGEAELHLLAVDSYWRGRGLGLALVETVINEATAGGKRGLVLWTQPSMSSAHRLYARVGFLPSPDEDFERGGRLFQVLRLKLGAR